MSEYEDAAAKVSAWLQPLADKAAPCGPDLEYDNDFLAISQAAQGRPESQFGPAEPPDWRTVRSDAETLLDRSRDLRLAIFWLRGRVHTQGWRALRSGLQLVTGLVEQQWGQVHPLPDPDDGDNYARVNALTLLRETQGLVGDLRAARLVQDRAIGEVTGRHVELAAGLAQAVAGENAPGNDTLSKMVADAVLRTPELKTSVQEAVQCVRQLQTAINDKLGASEAPDLRQLLALVSAAAALMPVDAVEEDAAEGDDGVGAGAAAGGGKRGGGLSGTVTSRDEALRAIEMVCDYLERTEPSNPAPLFLRRARQLVNHNFLQLLKELAPNVMPEMAHMVGVDPDSVESPEKA